MKKVVPIVIAVVLVFLAINHFVKRETDIDKNKLMKVSQEEDSRSSAWSIEQVKKAFADLPDVEIIVWDEENDWPIFACRKENKNKSLPSMDLDDFVVSLIAVSKHENPGVSIQAPGLACGTMSGTAKITDYQIVCYFPDWIAGTHLCTKLFEGDRILKALGFGQDPIDHKKVTSHVPGYQTLPQRASNIPGMKSGHFGLIWISPKEVIWQESEGVVKFDKISMKVYVASPYKDCEDFARHFEKHYNDFGKEQPIYRELLRIGRIIGAARWLVDKGYASRLDLKNYDVQSVKYYNKTSTIRGLVKEEKGRNYIKQLYLIGGVSYDKENSYQNGGKISSNALENLSSIIFKARPYNKAISWSFKINSEKYLAVALPFGG